MDILLAVLAGEALGALFWRCISGKWLPDGSFSASQAPSGIDWQKVNKHLDEGGIEKLYEHRSEINRT